MQNWLPKVPEALTVEFFSSAKSLEEIDGQLWVYLCNLIPDGAPYEENEQRMLSSISPSLRNYYLTRGFDCYRCSDGLEGCLMKEPDELYLLNETIQAYEELGALEHADIIRSLKPLAVERLNKIDEADEEGTEFDFDDGFWEPWEERWDAATESYDFYAVIFSRMKNAPENFLHKK